MGVNSVTLIITTKNRLNDLKETLSSLKNVLFDDIIICDDGSTDDTFQFIKRNYPQITLIRNLKSKGLIASRNRLMNLVKTPYVISLDDDANFLTSKAINHIVDYFKNNPSCYVIAFRIFWGLTPPKSTETYDKPKRVRDFPGGAHAMRMSAWDIIGEYPAWYMFYGEEDFASLKLFKRDLEIHYLPSVLVHHRVNVKQRKKNKDYLTRSKRALHAAWSNYLIFYPITLWPRKIAYSIYAQFKLKVFKGDFQCLFALLLAFFNLIINYPLRVKNRDKLTNDEVEAYLNLNNHNLYWSPMQEDNHEK